MCATARPVALFLGRYHLRRKLHFVVMRSVVDTACKIHTMYDLKGSLVGRMASARDRETGGVLKDKVC